MGKKTEQALTKEPLVALIMLNWNGLDYTRNALQSLRELDYHNKKVILWDNGSKNAEHKILAKEFSEVIVLHSKENLGYVGGCNKAISYAQRFKPKYVHLLNNDMTFDKEFLRKEVEVLEADTAEKIGVCGPKMNYMDYPDLIWSIGGDVSPTTGKTWLLMNKEKDRFTKKKIVPVGYTNGLARNILYEKVGMYDLDYFIYYDETDFCKRVKNEGYQIVCRLDSTAYHKVSLSDQKVTGLSTYYLTRNRFLFVKKYFSLPNRLMFYASFFLIDFPKYSVWYPLVSKNMKTLKIFYTGILDGLRGVKGRNTRFS